MEENINIEVEQENNSHFNKVTPLSKYLALALFVALPFVGGWIGYTYAPEKLVEVERIVVKEAEKEEVVSVEPEYTFTRLGVNGGSKDSPMIFRKDGKVFVFINETLSAGYSMKEIEGIDIDDINNLQLEYVGLSYLKDKENVYYIGVTLASNNTGEILVGADPESFQILSEGSLGMDKDSVYYEGLLLEGLNSNELEVLVNSNGVSILKDSDTVWYATGNCHYSEYVPGSFENIDTYQLPC